MENDLCGEKLIQETRDLLKKCQNENYVSSIHDLGIFLVFEMKKERDKLGLNDYQKVNPIQDVRDIFEKACRENAIRKITTKTLPDGTIKLTLNVLRSFELDPPKDNQNYKVRTIQEALNLHENSKDRPRTGMKSFRYDENLHKVFMTIRLDDSGTLSLIISFDTRTGKLVDYSLNYNSVMESYYDFINESIIRKNIYRPGDEEKYLDEIFIQYIKDRSEYDLVREVAPYTTRQFHYD